MEKQKRRNWNYKLFTEEAKKIHQDKYDYSLIKPEDILNAKSKPPIKCNKCQFVFYPTIDNHIKKKTGCSQCNIGKKWTKERFIKEVKEIHEDKYNYNQTDVNNIKNSDSIINCQCKTCNYKWAVTIESHIYSKTGCSQCNLGKKWTYERFMKEAKEIHGDKIDYSMVKKENIKTGRDKVPLKCNVCNYIWDVELGPHIYNQSGCKKCNFIPINPNIWNLKRLREETKTIHGNKYDISKVTEEQAKSCRSKIPIVCNICFYNFSPTIADFIHHKTGCRECAGLSILNGKKAKIKINAIHGDKYELLIDDNTIITGQIEVELKCNLCDNIWKTKIINIIRGGGCTKCGDNMPWNIAKFFNKLPKENEKWFEYTLVKENHFDQGHKGKLPIICRKCNKVFRCSIINHLWNLHGCPKCSMTKGERKCMQILDTFKLKYKTQVYFEEYNKLRYDIWFIIEEDGWILEYDGGQHFDIIEYFNMTEDSFQIARERDIFKTKLAIKNGYRVIRIDYTQFDCIEQHIRKALELKADLYLSRLEMYSWLLERL